MKSKKYIILILSLSVIGIGYLSYIMNEIFVYDENMYVAAGVLIQKYKLYSDFTFFQMPYQPIIYGIIYKFTGTSYYHFTGRLINFLSVMISIFLIYAISMKITKNFIISFFIMLIYGFNGIIIWSSGYINNSVIPIVFSLLGLLFYLKYSFYINEGGYTNKVGLIFCGIFLAAAVGIKVYYISVILSFILTASIFPLSQSFNFKLKKQVLPLMLGAFIGLIPVIFYMVKDFDVFIFNNLTYHSLNAAWRKLALHKDTGTISSKLTFFVNMVLIKYSIAIIISLLVLLVFVTICSIKKSIKINVILENKENFLLIVLSFFSTFFALAPSPLWYHYFALPLPFIVLLIGSVLNNIYSKYNRLLLILFICITGIAVYSSSGKLFSYTKKLNNPKEWLPIRIHQAALEASDIIKDYNVSGKIATFNPIFALEGGLDIYREYSSTYFGIRVGDFISEEKRNKYKVTTFRKYFFPFRSEPPAAFYIGDNPGYDNRFLKFAETNGYQHINTKFNYWNVYIKRK